MTDPDKLIDDLIEMQDSPGRNKSEEEEIAYQTITDANDIEFMTNQRGWSLLVESFEDRRNDAIRVLLEQVPGNEKAILAAHAVAVAVHQTIDGIISGLEEVKRNKLEALRYLAQVQEPRAPQYWEDPE